MESTELKAIQKPLKEKYKNEPEAALITLKAKGKIGEGITCKIETGKALIEAGLHPATGGSGLNYVRVICYWKRSSLVPVLL